MKWTKQDYKGNEQVWYSGDVIEKIKETCKTFGLISYHDKQGKLIAQTGNPVTAMILRIIEESEDKNAL